jgi:hypothetical protein
MHSKSTASMDDGQVASDLVLETLPSGEPAWLKPAPASPIDRYRLTERVVIVDQVEDPRYVLTTEGRKAIHGQA